MTYTNPQRYCSISMLSRPLSPHIHHFTIKNYQTVPQKEMIGGNKLSISRLPTFIPATICPKLGTGNKSHANDLIPMKQILSMSFEAL